MRRAAVFLSRFLLSLWVVLAAAFLVLLLANAPSVPNSPFAGISIRTEQNDLIHLPNRIFSCTETAQQFECQASLQNQLLELNFTKGDDYKYNLSNCRAFYDKRSLGCQERGQTYAPMLADIYEITNLNLSPQRIQEVQREYWSMNALTRLGELRLLWISTGLSLTAGISAAFFAWLHPGNVSKGFASFACGFGMYQLLGGLLGQVPYDAVTPYGVTPDTWNWMVHGGAIAAGLITLLATALLLWRRLNRSTNILLGSCTSAAIFGLCWWSFSWNSNYLLSLFGLADFTHQGYLLMRIFTTISTILAIVAAVLLGLRTRRSIQRFLCLGCGFGAVALATNLLLSLLLGLGYVD